MPCFFFMASLTFAFSDMQALQQNVTAVGWHAWYSLGSNINSKSQSIMYLTRYVILELNVIKKKKCAGFASASAVR